MADYSNILLASHGTPGARAAEELALASAASNGRLFQLVVVPDFWKGMMGDDWLNNARTRDIYARHVESQLQREIDEEVARVRAMARQHRLTYAHRVVLGKPAECLLACAAELRPDLVVIGSPRPPGAHGLRSRMHLDTLVRGLAVPLLVAPYPR